MQVSLPLEISIMSFMGGFRPPSNTTYLFSVATVTPKISSIHLNI